MPRPKTRKNSRTTKPGGQQRSQKNQLRIIGGQWRGRKLQFPEVDGLRPTGDRLRETLFNWLAPILPVADCLDLFAGSGALGLEALSRGAASVTFIDSSAAVSAQLSQHIQTLQARGATVIQQDALGWLQGTPQNRQGFDLVLLDPPFGQSLLAETIEPLLPWLKEEAWIYIETGRDEALPSLPASWHLHREKHSGMVSCRLFHHQLSRNISP